MPTSVVRVSFMAPSLRVRALRGYVRFRNRGREDSVNRDERRARGDEWWAPWKEATNAIGLLGIYARPARAGAVSWPLRSTLHEKGNDMKSKTLLLVGAAAVWCLAVSAALAEGTKGASDDRAAAGAHEAKGLKGEERQKALDECLKEEHGNGNGNGHG